jgi:hypothetical protein
MPETFLVVIRTASPHALKRKNRLWIRRISILESIPDYYILSRRVSRARVEGMKGRGRT